MRSLEQRHAELLWVAEKLEAAAYKRGWDDAQTATSQVIQRLDESPTIGSTLIIKP